MEERWIGRGHPRLTDSVEGSRKAAKAEEERKAVFTVSFKCFIRRRMFCHRIYPFTSLRPPRRFAPPRETCEHYLCRDGHCMQRSRDPHLQKDRPRRG